MSLWEDIKADYAHEQYNFEDVSEAERLEEQEEEREWEIEDAKNMLSGMSDQGLIGFICRVGPSLNTFPAFQAYDVAKRIRDNGWTPTRKQREALINTAAIALSLQLP